MTREEGKRWNFAQREGSGEGRARVVAGKSEIDNTKQKRATTRKAPRGELGGGREGKAASVMTVDKQQQCGMAQDTCHEMKGNREKNEEQGEKISHFLSRVLQGRYVCGRFDLHRWFSLCYPKGRVLWK